MKEKKRPVRNFFRKHKVWGILIIVFLFIAGLIGLLHTPPARNYIFSRVQNMLESQYGMQVDAEKIRYSLLNLSVSISRLDINGKNSSLPLEKLSAEALYVNIGIQTILGGPIHLQKIRILDPEVHLQPASAEQKAPEKETDPKPLNIRIDDLSLRRGTMVSGGREIPIQTRLDQIRIAVRYQKDKDLHRALLSLGKGYLQHEDRRFPINAVHIPIFFGNDYIRLQDLRLESPFLILKASGRIDQLQSGPEPDIHFSAAVKTEALNEILRLRQSFQGILHAEGKIFSSPEGPEIKGSLNAEDLRVSGIPVFSLSGEISYQPSHLTLDLLSLESSWGNGEAQGIWYPSAGETSRLTLSWSNVKLGKILSRVYPEMHLTAETRGIFKGEWTQLDVNHLDARLEAEFGSFENQKKKTDISGRIIAGLENGSAVIEDSRIAFPGGMLALEGTLSPERSLQADLNLKIHSFSRLISHFPQKWNRPEVEGGFTAEAVIEGTSTQPRITFDAASSGISYRNLSLSRLNTEMEYQNNSLSIDELRLASNQGIIQISGQIEAAVPEFTLGKSAFLELEAEELSLEPVFSVLFPALPVTGTLQAQSTLQGPLTSPKVQFDLSVSPLKIREETLDALSAEGSYSPESLSLEKLRIVRNRASISGSGQWNFVPETLRVNLSGGNIPIQTLSPVLPESYTYSGEIHFQAEAAGPISEPKGQLKFTLEHFRAGELNIGDLTLESRSDGKNLSARLYTQNETIQAQAEIPFEKPRLIQASLDINGFNLGAWLPPKPGPEGPAPPFSTSLEATGKISIPLANPRSLSGNLSLSSLGFSYRDLQFTLPQPLSLSFSNETLSLRQLHISGPQTEILAEGSIPLSNESGRRISLSGRINLGAAEPFISGARLQGKIRFDTSVSGSIAEPEFNGNLRLAEVKADYSPFPYSLDNLAAEIEWNSGIFTLEDFSAQTGGGDIQAEGRFHIPGLAPGGGKIEKDRLSLQWQGLSPAPLDRYLPPEYRGKLNGVFSGNLTASGDFLYFSEVSMEGRMTRFQMALDPFEMEAEKDIRFTLNEGRLSLESFRLSGSRSAVQMQGTMDLTGPEPQIRSRLSLSLDGGALSPFVESALLSGTANLNLTVQGPVKEPVISGSGGFQNFYVQLQAIPLIINNLEGKLNFSDSLIEISSLEASANGGPLSVTGKIEYSSFSLDQLRLNVNFQRLRWNYPEGLHSLNRGDLNFLFNQEEWKFTGNIEIQQAYFEKDIYIGTELINQIRLNRVQMETEMPEFLKQLNLDIQISTPGELIIDNNLAELGLTANLVLQGTPANPQISGLIRNPFTGEILLGDRRYQVESFQIDFPGGGLLEARINLLAHTSVSGELDTYDVQLAVTGPLTDISTSLTSTPPLSEAELASLLITGREIEDLKSGPANVLGNQLLLYFTSPLTSPVTKTIENLFQAEEVRIVPINIATEEDPGARFTFRKNLIKNVDIIYSVDITNTQDQTWILEYDLSRNFTLRALRRDDGSYGSGVEHHFGLGKPDYGKAENIEGRTGYILQQIRFSGNTEFEKSLLRNRFNLPKPGSGFNYGKLQSAADKIEEFYRRRNYLNAVISPRISYGEDNTIRIEIHIESGKPVILNFQGDPLSSNLKETVIQSWNGRLPQPARISEASRRILKQLQGKGYYHADVKHALGKNPDGVQHNFIIDKGVRFEIGEFSVTGGEAIPENTIRKIINNLPGTRDYGLWKLVRGFSQVREQLERQYEEQGYMNVRIHPPEITTNRRTRKVNITLSIDQGEQSRVDQLHFESLKAFSPEKLKESLRLVPGSVFSPSNLAMDINNLIDLYRSRGYQNIEISAGLRYQEDEGVELTYTIKEGVIHTIQDIVISGNRRTPDRVILRELTFKEGDRLVQSQLVESQRNLYNLNIFDLVNIHRKSQPEKPGNEIIQIQIREMPLFYFGYGLRYNSEDKLGGFGEVEFNNLFGRARNGILYYQQNQTGKNLRFSLTDPYFFGLPVNTLHSLYFTNEKRVGLNTDEIGYTVEQQLQLPFSFSLSYLYRINRIHTYELEQEGPFPYDITILLSEVSTYLIRDTRSDKLNAQTGSFFSLSLTYSPEYLGSDLTYVRMFGQYSLFLPLPLPFNLTWASNLRLGLADAFDQVLIPNKRFYAGGGNSIRGFEKDQVGPYNPFLERPTGGEGLFILNQELRFPIYKWFSGVAFFDAGNIYRHLKEFKPWELRTSAGLGLRINSPAGLLRLDYGFNLAPKPGEPGSVFFFSIGQAF